MIPGEYQLKQEPLEANVDRPVLTLEVSNTGDRPVQIGSHFHFFEVNRWLQFDREQAYGMRLNIPAGTAVRFEPGDSREVELVALGGTRQIWGLNGLINGSLDDPQLRETAMDAIKSFVAKGNS
ncbi:MAG: urease subunit beta [SAR324 cluster bacterium]|nr:urease subunit beta [SAR324 cluster bacterium]